MPSDLIFREDAKDYALCKTAIESRGDKILGIGWVEHKPGNYMAAEIQSDASLYWLSAVYHIYYDEDGNFTSVEHQWTKWLRCKDPEIAAILDFGDCSRAFQEPFKTFQ